MRRHIPVLVLMALAIASITLGRVRAGEPAAAPAAQVTILNYKFDPEVLTVPAGTTVTWVNKDEVPHTVASSDKRFPSSSGLDTGEAYSYTFTTPGSYGYYCTLHPFMKGTIVVTAAGK